MTLTWPLNWPIREVKSSGAELPAAMNVAPATSSLSCRFWSGWTDDYAVGNAEKQTQRRDKNLGQVTDAVWKASGHPKTRYISHGIMIPFNLISLPKLPTKAALSEVEKSRTGTQATAPLRPEEKCTFQMLLISKTFNWIWWRIALTSQTKDGEQIELSSPSEAARMAPGRSDNSPLRSSPGRGRSSHHRQ